jgi:cytochrome bd ubiquinol oxidase subunit I
VVQNGAFVPNDWAKIVLNSVVWVRFPRMILAAYLTGAFCVAATGAWYLLRNEYHAEARIMLGMGLFFAAVLVPVQIFFGHLTGDYVHGHQPAKFAAIEGRWHDEQPAGEVLIAIPDPAAETNHYEIKVPVLGSLIASMSFTSKEVGLTDFPPQDRPPVFIPFFTFTGSEVKRSAMLAAVAPIWGGNETWLVMNAVVCGAPFQSPMRVSYQPFIFLSLSCSLSCSRG